MVNRVYGPGFGRIILVIGGFVLSKWLVKMMVQMNIYMHRYQSLFWIICMHQRNGLWHEAVVVCIYLGLKLKIFGTNKIIDRWATFGHFNRIGKLNTAQFAIEPLPVIDAIIIGHQVSTGCLRRLPFHTRCLDFDCFECDGIYLDLEHLWSINVAPTVARALLKILPIKKNCTFVETNGYGNISPDHVDWDKLERGFSK